MGLLDSVLGSAMGAMTGGVQGEGGLMQVVSGLLGSQQGGLAGLVQQLQQGGLGEAVQSWISTGHNLPVSAEQLQSVLGGDQVSAMAQQAGLSQGDLMGQLAQLLPQVVDKLTPNGELAAGSSGNLGDVLGGLLGGLLKR